MAFYQLRFETASVEDRVHSGHAPAMSNTFDGFTQRSFGKELTVKENIGNVCLVPCPSPQRTGQTSPRIPGGSSSYTQRTSSKGPCPQTQHDVAEAQEHSLVWSSNRGCCVMATVNMSQSLKGFPGTFWRCGLRAFLHRNSNVSNHEREINALEIDAWVCA